LLLKVKYQLWIVVCIAMPCNLVGGWGYIAGNVTLQFTHELKAAVIGPVATFMLTALWATGLYRPSF
jgi:hypothetical protein